MTAIIGGPNAVKCFCSNTVLVNVTFGQNTWYQITTVEGQNVHDQIAFCAFHSCLVEFQMNAGYIHETHV